MKLFVTGDNHIGKKYDRYPNISGKLVQTRFDCLEDMIKKAEQEACQLFVVTGDLFDSVNLVKVADIKAVVAILCKFSGTVLVLPGNHDYYTGDEKVWKHFIDEADMKDANIILLNEYTKRIIEVGEEKVTIFPAFCDSKHSKENKLAWIKAESVSEDTINIGIAHGALAGITPDINEEYFLMSEKELQGISMDAWLIGHTHIPYPADLSETEDKSGYYVFNPGTHAQTDLHNNTEGNSFIINITKQSGMAKISARKYVSGKIRFFDLNIEISPQKETSLKDALIQLLCNLQDESVVRVKISGSIKKDEYYERQAIYKNVFARFLDYEIVDSELSEEITIDTIRDEYAETSFAAKFMEQLVDNPTELQMAYLLVEQCKEA